MQYKSLLTTFKKKTRKTACWVGKHEKYFRKKSKLKRAEFVSLGKPKYFDKGV
jgi:hypothetical protein